MSRLASVLVAVVWASSCNYADVSGDSNERAETLADGVPDPSAAHSAFAVALGLDSPTPTYPDCSGALIAPSLVLTAGHCAAAIKDVRFITEGLTFGRRAVADCYLHPAAYSGESECYWGSVSNVNVHPETDLALMVLDSPITDVLPRPISPPRTCLRPDDTEPVVVRGFAGPTTEWGPRRRAVADAYLSSGLLYGPFLTQPGDSGGPYTELRYDEELGPVLAVTSKGGGNNTFIWSEQNLAWIWSVIDPAGDCAYGAAGPCQPLGFDAPLPDTDGDGLPDVRDLCPTVALSPEQAAACNDQHCDTDGDWVGNECDTYPGPCNHADMDEDGIPDEVDPCPLLPSSEHTLDDRDGDGVPNACDRCPGLDDTAIDPGVDTDGDGVPNGCDNCPDHPNAGQQNCNVDRELAQSPPVVQGDACDPDPCPRINASRWFPASGPTTYASSNAGMSGYALGVGATVEGTMRTGVRWCPCTFADDDRVDRRLLCAGPLAANCVQAASQYTAMTTSWRVMSHGFVGAEGHPGTVPGKTDTEWIFPYRPPPESDTAAGRDFAEDFITGFWDFESDAFAAGTLQSFGSGPLSLTRTPAVVWAHARHYETPVAGSPGPDAFGCNLTASCSSPNTEFTSHYYSGITEEEHGLLPSFYANIDSLIGWALLGPRVCPQCVRALPMPVLTRACAFQGYLCLRNGTGNGAQILDRPVWENIDPVLLAAWKDEPQLRWLVASEPHETLLPGAIRFAAYDPTLRRVGLLGVITDAGFRALGGSAGLLQDAHVGSFELLSGNTATVLAVGGYLNNQPSAFVRRLDLLTGERDDVQIALALGAIRAAAVDPSGRWLLAMDDAPGGGRRLVRIDLATGAATVLATGGNSAADRHAIAAMPGGSWVVVGSASSWGQYALVVFHAAPGGAVTQLRSFFQNGTLAASHAATNDLGVSFLLNDQLGWRPAGVRNAEMQSAVPLTNVF